MNKEKNLPVSNSATLQDIAQSVGISKVAVSVVLNGATSNTRVSAKTRQRILDAAAVLNYHPNAAAQGLKRGRTNTLGLLFGLTITSTQSMASALSASIIQGVAVAAEAERHNLMLFTDLWRNGKQDMNCLRDQRADGAVIAMPLIGTGMIEALLALKHPLVFIGYSSQTERIVSVDVDNVRGGYDAAQHLLSLGHQRIAHFQGDGFYACTAQRREGFLRAMQEAGVAVPPEYLISDSYSGATTEENFHRIMALPLPPTAIFCGNDLMAGKLLRAAAQAGVSVPQQLSVIGFDDVFLPTYMDAPVTTIRQPFFEMGCEAARLLLQKLRGEEVPDATHLLSHELIVRHTTAPPSKNPA